MSEQVFQQTLDAIMAADAADKRADEAFSKAKADFGQVEAEYRKRKGLASLGDYKALIKKYGPMVATYFGIPGGAGAVTALLADDGAFSGVLGALKTIASKFALGS